MLANPDSTRRKILKIVAQENYRPQKPKKFLALLGLTSDDARPLRMLIRDMVDKGELAFGDGHFIIPVTKTGDTVASSPPPSAVCQPHYRTLSTATLRHRFCPSSLGFRGPYAR
jgi:hypothetical protein